MLDHILGRLYSRLEHIVGQIPLDLDYLEFICTQELVAVSLPVLDAMRELHRLINVEKEKSKQYIKTVQFEQGPVGRPRMVISPEYIHSLLELNLSIPCIAALLGVSRRTVHRRMAESDFTVRELYSTLTDEELDQCVRDIKCRQPHSGYRMMKALLQAQGLRVLYDRVRASLHRVETIGVISRMNNLGCIVRRTYSVPSPQSLMHIDTNHKLIRYNIVIFGGIDGFSRKLFVSFNWYNRIYLQIMYLGAASNNLASTNLDFFQESVEKFGFPLRIERLWRDMWTAVTVIYYDALHYLKEEDDLDTFRSGWANHPINRRPYDPNQLWELGRIHHPIPVSDNMEGVDIPQIEWENRGFAPDGHSSVIVPDTECPPTDGQMAALREAVDPRAASQSFGSDIYIAAVQFYEHRALERELEKELEKGLGKGLERELERGLERALERELEKGLEKGLERGLERELQRELERRLER
ncbi:hypothetical protein F7725_013602 [Dissostichus mawsoni]|uniref:Integrase core domain-containing protein n=1 Tax=Dissostichus mawsoni TaxID=36200 RepID=A0A7J5Y4G0_DISMA|nr:hypothetical protein F7725_013602 [Dissostichus mawsoni]